MQVRRNQEIPRAARSVPTIPAPIEMIITCEEKPMRHDRRQLKMNRCERRGRDLALASALACLAVAMAGERVASATNVRYAQQKPIVVKLEFDGDPSFPSLTVLRPTPGLAAFTGGNFGLTPAQRTDVVQRVMTLLQADYVGSGLNVEFVTQTAGISEFYTWGIDDSALIVPTGDCANPGLNFERLYGKAGSGFGNDCNGASIHFPRHARTWAGSFTVFGAHAPSQPPLRVGNTFGDGTVITTAHIAQALANSAAHEIGHLFGLKHPVCADDACRTGRLMFSSTEEVEARNDKSFDPGELDSLRTAIGNRFTLVAGPTGTVRDPETGLMMTADANLPASLKVGSTGGQGDGALSFTDAQPYAAALDYLGYDDWRLPDALPPSGVGPPCTFVIFGPPAGTVPCYDGELGLFARNFIHCPATSLLTGLSFLYWATPPPSLGPWVDEIFLGEQVLSSTTATSVHAWPVRGAYGLIDAGDGTIVDPARRLMWMREPTIFAATNQFDAVQAVGALGFAGYDDWRLPRVGSQIDYTCSNTDLFTVLRQITSTGCARSELGQLYWRWGVREGSPAAPFSLPTGSGKFWYEDVLGATGAGTDEAFFFDFRDGKQGTGESARAQLARGRMWPVRDLEPGYVPRGNNVIADVLPSVVVRLRRVDHGGAITATVQTASPPPRPPLGNPKTYVFQNRGAVAYDRSDETANVICLRYTDDELPLVLNTRLAIQRTINGGSATILPMLPGYPDSAHHIACASTAFLTEFKVVAVPTRLPGPIPLP
jgi:hypothetical protein